MCGSKAVLAFLGKRIGANWCTLRRIMLESEQGAIVPGVLAPANTPQHDKLESSFPHPGVPHSTLLRCRVGFPGRQLSQPP